MYSPRRKPAILSLQSIYSRVLGDLPIIILLALFLAFFVIPRSPNFAAQKIRDINPNIVPEARLVPKREASVAFHLQISNSTLPLLPRLLDRLYHPDNLYLIHIDPSADSDRRQAAFTKASYLLQKKNVHLMQEELMTYQGITLALNTINAMHDFLLLGDWDYFINLSGGDYPLISPYELRRYLSQGIPSQRLFMAFSPESAWETKVQRRLGKIHADTGLSLRKDNRTPIRTRLTNTYKTNTAALHSNGTIAAGDAWMILPRSFCKFVVFSNEAKRLLALMATMSDPIEHYFHTLVWNHPGWREKLVKHGFRHIVWHHQGVSAGQHPYYLDTVEDANEEGYMLWNNLKESPYFFARKFVTPDSRLMDMIDSRMSGIGRRVDKRSANNARTRRRENFECSLKKGGSCGMDPNKFGG